MCAIAGLVDLEIQENTVKEMLKTMTRRGPDGDGFYISESCGLLHTRLAIIDPQGGAQPMSLKWEDEEYILAYNGELYNTAELRNTLSSLGHSFKSHSDTEVLLHGYAHWGISVLERLNGIFAFAVWEKRKKRLFLARDRIGVKPLFYKLHEGGLLFASELKTILKYPTVKAELDITGIGELILLGPGRVPGSGVFKGIQELQPGCCGYYYNGTWSWNRYWYLKDGEHTENFEQTAETVRFFVTDAIQRQMISDVPIGTFLSGGLDSSIISAVCSMREKNEGRKLKTFSVDYENNDLYFESSKFQPDSDRKYISVMQRYLDSCHYQTVLTPENLLSVLDDATIARDLPGMADVDFSMLAFCREIRSHVKVALSGECADEIFGGYPWYRDPDIRDQEGFPWAQNTKERLSLLCPDVRKDLDPMEFVYAQYKQTIDSCDILPETNPEDRRMKEMVVLNHKWFMQTLLDRKDRMSMYSGLEVRVPFCDHRIAEYLYRVPWKYKDYNSREKGLLRYAMEGCLPKEVLYRKKSPYPKTHDPQYAKMVRGMLRHLLEQNNAPVFQMLSKEAVQKMLYKELTWPWYGQLMRMPQTIAYILQINRWLELYNVSLV